MKKVSVRPMGAGEEGMEKQRENLAEQLRKANMSGVTRWLGLKERLDFSVLDDFKNFRLLLRLALLAKISGSESDEEKRMGAETLLKALEAYEAGLRGPSEDDAA